MQKICCAATIEMAPDLLKPSLPGAADASMSAIQIIMSKHREKSIQTTPLVDFQAVKTDPQGSWTGVPAIPDEVPVQDADDL